jgi:hypothetical protein
MVDGGPDKTAGKQVNPGRRLRLAGYRTKPRQRSTTPKGRITGSTLESRPLSDLTRQECGAITRERRIDA